MGFLKEGEAVETIPPACDALQGLKKGTTDKKVPARNVAGIVADYAVSWLGESGDDPRKTRLIGDCIEARLCKIEQPRGNMADLLNHNHDKKLTAVRSWTAEIALEAFQHDCLFCRRRRACTPLSKVVGRSCCPSGRNG